MKDCSRASKCQYGCCNEPYKCELNDDKPYYKEIEEMEMIEIAADIYYAGGIEDYE